MTQNSIKYENSKLLIDKISTVINIGNEFRKSYNERYALDFDPLNLFKINENKLSELLAFLLDPEQAHGQKDKFLNLFMDQIVGVNLDNAGEFEYIECEEATADNRRLDIVISFKNLVIGIENKIWAVDQMNQLKDYYQALKGKGKEKSVLVYLTPYGKEPGEHSITREESKALQSAGNLHYWSYVSDVIPFLKMSLGIVEPPLLRNFIIMMELYLSNKFLGKKSLIMDKKIKNLVQENLETTKAIVTAYQSLISDIKIAFNKLIGHIKRMENVVLKEDVDLRVLDWTEGGVHYFRNDFMKKDLCIVLQIAQHETRTSIQVWSKSNEILKENFKDKTRLDFKSQELTIEEIKKLFRENKQAIAAYYNDSSNQFES
ncbi:PD-(D/E)XK nuclease family protein [Nonlabens sp. MIC269]|uniref:PDDEXK-like family protein n=1 Tax=Nonlabens sp. MIC269 TaxID=1476901 RepID=UPI000761E5C5|nr:PD-(D/E)XK nuclease family protein [Nonlabens sp. MIC269]